MCEPIPVIKYSFDSCALGTTATTVTNEGSYTGMNGTFNKTGTGKYEIIKSVNGRNYLSFTGGNNSNGAYIKLPTLTFGGSAWSVSFWYYKAASTISEWCGRIFDFSTPVAGQKGFGLYFDGNGRLAYYQADANYSVSQNITATSLLDSVWRHVAFVCDATNKKCLLYLNSVLVNTLNFPTVEKYTRTACYIGKSAWADNYPTYLLDDFRLYDCTLSPSNVTAIYNIPIIKYTFDLNTVSDLIVTNEGGLGTDYNGLTENVQIVSYADPPTGSNCLLITIYDMSGFVIVPLLQFSTNRWAIGFYYKILQATGTTENYALFSTSTLSLRMINNGCLYLTINGNNFPVCASNICDGTWRHIAITYNSTTTTYSIYFNGVLCTYPIVTTAALSSTTENFYIGDANFLTSNLTNHTYFYIDDFRIYNNTVLTIDDIAQMCGNNCIYYKTSLLNTLLNAYIPNTTYAGQSSMQTRLGKNNNIALCYMYAKATCLTGVETNFNLGCFTPLTIPGCCVYLSADSASNFTLNNGNVQQWNDLSGNGCHAIQSIAANQPLYKTTTGSIVCYKPYVQFNGGSTTGLTVSCPNLASVSSFTIVIVLYLNQTSTTDQTMIGTNGTWAPGFYKCVLPATATTIRTDLYGSSYLNSNWGFTATWPYEFF